MSEALSSPRVRPWLWLVLRLAVSAGLLSWLLTRLGGDLAELRELRWPRLWPAAVVFALSTCLGALQWGLLLRQGQLRVGAWRVFRLYWAGLFASNFLPTSFGGDLLKVADLAMHDGGVVRPFAATLLDRLLGLLALILLAGAAGIALDGSRPAGIPWWLLLASTLPVLAALVVLLSRRLNAQLSQMLARLSRGRRGRRLSRLGTELVRYRLKPARLVLLLLLALLVQSLRLLTHLLVAQELGIALGLQLSLQLVVVITLLALAMVLPITFNGIGLREWAATQLLPQLGLAAATAVSWQLATYLVQVAVSLIGGVIFAVELSRGRLLGRFGPTGERGRHD